MLDARGRFVTACGNSAVIDEVLLDQLDCCHKQSSLLLKLDRLLAGKSRDQALR